jgi:hypothetical protein
MFSALTPEPTSTGIPTARLASRTWAGSVGSPVAAPVTTTPSARKNSAAWAVAARSTSAVMACAECFFLMSAKTLTSSAPMARR